MASSKSTPESSFPFLKLPAELRNMIYSLLLAQGTIKIRSINILRRGGPLWQERGAKYKPICLSLLQVCKHIYQEAQSFFYTRNTFKVCWDSATPFIRDRTPEQLRLISTLKINIDMASIYDYHWYQDLPYAVAKLSGLKTLQLTILDDSSGKSRPKPVLDRKRVLVREIEAWRGLPLREGKVKIKFFRTCDGRVKPTREMEELAEELTAGMMGAWGEDSAASLAAERTVNSAA